MSLGPAFTQSEPFHHTDQLITRLQVVVMINFIRMLLGSVIVIVFKTDAVFWWAAIFRNPSSMFDKMLHLSKSQGSAMSRSRSHDLREAVGNLLTVTMYLQDTLSRFVSTWRGRRLAPLRFTNPRAAELSVHRTIVPSEQLHVMLHWSLVAIPSQAPTNAINSDYQNSSKPCSVSWKRHTWDTTCFQQNP